MPDRSPAPPPARSPGGRLSVVMPAHNEEAYLEGAVEAVVEGLQRRGRPFEVLVCENGSSDATAEVAAALARRHPEVRVLRLPSADYGWALRAGFLAATGEVVVNFDVDFVDLGFLDLALEELDGAGTDVVLGSKRLPGASDHRPAGRQAVTAVFSLLLRYGFGLGATDTHGLKALRREPLLLLVEKCRSGREIFDTELVMRAERAGLGVVELPVNVSDQRPPRTSIASRIPRSLAGLARLRLALWREARSRGRSASARKHVRHPPPGCPTPPPR